MALVTGYNTPTSQLAAWRGQNSGLQHQQPAPLGGNQQIPAGTGGIKPSQPQGMMGGVGGSPQSMVQATGGMNNKNLGMVGQLYNQGIQSGGIQAPGVQSMGAKAMLSQLLGVDKGSMGKRKMIKELYAKAGLSSDGRMTNRQMLTALLGQGGGNAGGGVTEPAPGGQEPNAPVAPVEPVSKWQGMPDSSFMANA